MHVRLTQIIDYWLGVPICFLLSVWNQILRCLSGRRTPEGQPEKILFIELSEMGSAVLAHSALEQCHKRYPKADLYFLIFERNRESVEVLGSIPIENVLTISDSSFLHFMIDSIRFFVAARRLRIDTVIDLELFSRASMIISYLSGAVRRVGFFKGTSEGLYRGDLLTHTVSYNAHQHMPLNFLALIATLGGHHQQGEYLKENLSSFMCELPQFVPRDYEREKMSGLLKSLCPEFSQGDSLIIINPDPGEALPMRGWALERFVECIKQIRAHQDRVFFVVMGLARSANYVGELNRALEGNSLIDFTGKTENIREMLTLFTLANVLLTSDSGPAHFAALTKIHSIVLFGPETPLLYRPLGDNVTSLTAQLACSPCLSAFNHRYTRCTDNRCMQAISTELVTLNLTRALKASREDRRG